MLEAIGQPRNIGDKRRNKRGVYLERCRGNFRVVAKFLTLQRCGRRAAAAPAGRARASHRTRAVAAGGGVRWNPAQQVSVRWPRRDDAFGQSLVPTYLRVVAPCDRLKHTPRGPNSIAVGARPKPFIPRQAAKTLAQHASGATPAGGAFAAAERGVAAACVCL